MRSLSEKEQGELNFWFDHLHGGCERELGKSFLDQWSTGARGRLARYQQEIPDLTAQPGATWVDVGTGPYSVLMQAPAEVVKIMIDPLMKHYIKYRLVTVADAPPQSVFLAAFGEDLPLADETADFVACTNTLDHVDNPWMTVDELARILKVGGTLALEVDTGGVVDYMHPHAMSAEAIDGYFASRGVSKIFGIIAEDPGKRRPEAQLYFACYRRVARTADEFQRMAAIRRAIHPVLVQEGLHGFNIVRLRDPETGDWYYALPQNDGAFSYDKVVAGGYSALFRDKTIEEVRRQVEAYDAAGRGSASMTS
jgi:ubiquinone/menaquinone biosynthesis C-methylase UbiE